LPKGPGFGLPLKGAVLLKAVIVRGFLNVDIEGLPAGLKEKLDKAVAETQKDMM
jgi:hypothetical protein